jgi:hypothetical protein
MRSNLNRTLNALKRHHQIQFTTQEAFDSLEQAMEVFMSLHQQRRHAKGETGLFTNEPHRHFHQDLAQIFADNRWLRLHFLCIDNTPVAANYCFAYRSTMYNYQSGFDPAFTKFGVGHLLTLYSINEAIREGMTRFDFTIGDEPYKHRWTAQSTCNIELHYRRQGISSRIYQWGSTSPTIRRISRKLGLTDPTHYAKQHSHEHARVSNTYLDEISRSLLLNKLNQWSCQTPQATAILAPNRTELSYQQLYAQIVTVKHALNTHSIERQDRVAVVLPNGPEMAVTFCAVASSATCAPLNPSYRAKEFEFYLSDLNAKALILPEGMKSPAVQIAQEHRIQILRLAPHFKKPAGVYSLTAETQRRRVSATHIRHNVTP